jgi:hypothetical protein
MVNFAIFYFSHFFNFDEFLGNTGFGMRTGKSVNAPISAINPGTTFNYQTTYQNPLSTANSQYFGENDDYAHVKKIRFLKNRVISLEDKVLELKKELKEYKKIVKGLEGIDPNVLNLEIENERLKTNFQAILSLKMADFDNFINIQGAGQEFTNMNTCLNNLQNDPTQCQVMRESLEKIIVQ